MFEVGTLEVAVRGSEGGGEVTGVGAAVGAGNAAFLVRGVGGFGVVTGLGVVVGASAEFLGRGAGDGAVVGLDGFTRCAWAAPVATSPPPMRASANEAARIGRRCVMGSA